VTYIVFVIAPLVIVLFVLIFRMNYGAHFTPQAYYRRKVGGAPVAGEYEALGPRPRRAGPDEDVGRPPGGGRRRRRRRAEWKLEGGRSGSDGGDADLETLI
jgi:hypothetical protein